MKRILMALILCVGLDTLPAVWPNIEQSWDIYAICVRVEVLLWLVILCSFIPYRKLAAKSLIVASSVVEAVNALSMLFAYGVTSSPYFLYSIKTIGCIGLVTYFLWRDYEKGSDKIDEVHFFLVGIRPRSFQDFILSLISEPIGGIGVYAKGKLYHYRHGRLVTNNKEYLKRTSKKYRIIKRGEIDDIKLRYLESLIDSKYSKWSLLRNCKTVLEPTIGRRGKPLF